MLAVTADETGVLPAVKVKLVKPAGTVTEVGTITAELSLERAITAPPAGARSFKTTVTLTGSPAMVALTEETKLPSNGSMMRELFRVAVAPAAVMMLACDELTAVVVIGKLAFVAPPATVTVAGTVLPLGEVSVNVVPPAGATALKRDRARGIGASYDFLR